MPFPSSDPPRIAVVGAGLIGRRHAEAIARSPAARLSGLADTAPEAAALAARLGAPLHPGLSELLSEGRPDGVIIATPNALHVEQALACVAAGVPALVEKPIATDPAEGRRLVDAAARAGVPLMTGHHRRHNPIVAAAREAIASGRIGRVAMVSSLTWLMKPDPYFEPDWRRAPGAGPLLVNLIHDIDLLRHFCGDVAEVQAMESHALRGHAVEDGAVALLRFESGALGSMSVSDAAVGPWSWELTAAENPAYPETGQSCCWIAGTEGALEIPNLRLWRNPGPTGWHEPLEAVPIEVEKGDPLDRQIAHFADVIRGRAAPTASGEDGLRALEVLDAIKRAARDGVATRPRDTARSADAGGAGAGGTSR